MPQTHLSSFYTLSTQKKKWWQPPPNTVGLHEAEMVHGDVVCLGAVCIPCALDLVAELKLCCAGLISRVLWVQSRGHWFWLSCTSPSWYKSMDSGAGSIAGEKAASISFQPWLFCAIQGYWYEDDLFCTYRWVSSVVLGVSQEELDFYFSGFKGAVRSQC